MEQMLRKKEKTNKYPTIKNRIATRVTRRTLKMEARGYRNLNTMRIFITKTFDLVKHFVCCIIKFTDALFSVAKIFGMEQNIF